MTRAIIIAGIGTVLAAAAFAQQDPAALKFEAADVHPVPQTASRSLTANGLHGAQYQVRSATMVDLIAAAYGIDSDKVLGGPNWIELDRFDLIAKAPAGTTPDSAQVMLRNLLASRFSLVARREDKPMPAYALTATKHLLIKESTGSGEPGCKQSLQGFQDGPVAAPATLSSITVVMSCHNVTIPVFLDELPLMRRQGDISRPILDHTDLKGTWSFDFQFSLGAGPGDMAPIAEAMEKQLGLKFESVMVPLPVVEVKSVNRKPTANSPEEMNAFPALATEFDVAEIRPFKGNDNSQTFVARGGGGVMVASRVGGRGSPALQNGRLTLQGLTLKELIVLAWDIRGDDMLIGAPKWIDTDRWSVIAKAPGGPGADAFTDMDAVRPLLRKLLMDRFQMTVHTEERPMTGYVLRVIKSKMKPADPSERTRWLNGPPPDGKDPTNGNRAMGRVITCQNMTMGEFAELLPNIAPAYFRGTTILDQTGLEGSFDFTFYFVPSGAIDGGGRGMVRVGDGAAAPGNAQASDPSGGLSLFDALTKILGLKLETQKRPMPVLVIDHVEPKPIDN